MRHTLNKKLYCTGAQHGTTLDIRSHIHLKKKKKLCSHRGMEVKNLDWKFLFFVSERMREGEREWVERELE